MNKLFEPGRIGRLDIKNRLVMAAMGTHSCDAEGFITEKALRYYSARAAGGVGLVIVQSSAVTKGDGTPKGMRLYDDRFIPGMKKLATVIHDGGARTLLQLNHHGKMFASIRMAVPHPEEIEVIGPSAVPSITDSCVPREMSKEDITIMAAAFADAACRAKEAGFDGVEVHAAHAYLLHSFLSPLTNFRNDEYGGSPENRVRFVCEVLKAVRRKVGQEFVITVRISGMEPLDGGIRIEDVILQAPHLVDAGADAIHVSAGATDYPILTEPCYLEQDGVLVHLAEAVKKAVKIPVITVGKIGDPVLASRIIQEGKADFVAMGRPLLADPELPNKAREGRLEDINYCIFCNNCFRMLFAGGKMSDFTCTVNPDLLGESDHKRDLAEAPKKVMVIGGGLAGMMAARDMAFRGHSVFLYEKGSMLGGQWNVVCMERGKEGFARFAEYLKRGLNKSGAKIFLNSEVDQALVSKERPDAVVVATGAFAATLDVPGAQGRNVVQAVDVIAGTARVGDSVLVLGGRYLGMEMALALAEQGKRVKLVTRRELGKGVELSVYLHLRDALIERGVQIFTNSPVLEIRETGAYVTHQNRALFLKAETVVLAAGSNSENELAEQLKGMVPELYVIGDCVRARTAIHATQEAARVARQI